MPKTSQRKRSAQDVDEKADDDDSNEELDSSDSGSGTRLQSVIVAFDVVQDNIVKKRKKSIKKLTGIARKKKDEVLARQTHVVNVSRPTELNGMLSDLQAKVAENDTLIAQLWDEVAQIDKEAQQACKTYDDEMVKIIQELGDARKGSIAAIGRIISEHQSLGGVFSLRAADDVDAPPLRSTKKPRVTDVTLIGSD